MKYALYSFLAAALVSMSSGCATTCCGPAGGGGAIDTMFGGCTTSASCGGGCTSVGGGCASTSGGPAYATVSDGGCGGARLGGGIAAPVISSARNLAGGCGAAGGCGGAGLLGGGGCGGGCGGAAAGLVGAPAQALVGGLDHVKRTVANMPQTLQNGCANGTQGEFMGPTSGMVQYPYYTTRGPRDFFMANPPSIGP